MNEQLATMTIETLAPLVRDGEVSPVEVTASVLDRAEAYNDTLCAYIRIAREDAERAAEQAEKEIMVGNYRGLLHGIPMAIKDNIYFKDQVTTMGSKIHSQFVSDYDATVVRRLADAGAVFVGKLNMHEYALGGTTDNPYYGTCRNPWDITRIPGGSSGGSAAAIAADMTIGSLGTDTSGSIRIPASMCGIVGLKPTFGRVSKYGCFPEAWTLDHIGPMTKSVFDAAAVLEVIAGFDKQDPTSVNVPSERYTDFLSGDISEMVIGVNEAFYFKEVDDTVSALVWQSIRALEKMGATVVPVEIPTLEYAEFALTMTDISETSTVHHENLKKRPQDYGPEVRLLLEFGEIPSAIDYLQAQQLRRLIKHDFRRVFEQVDVLIGPTLPVAAGKIGEYVAEMNGNQVDLLEHIIRLVGPANLTGLPSLSVPCGFKDGLPVGMQIIGPAFGEGKVLKMGHAFERTHPLEGKKPNLHFSNV